MSLVDFDTFEGLIPIVPATPSMSKETFQGGTSISIKV
jgi:hypothetical protein